MKIKKYKNKNTCRMKEKIKIENQMSVGNR